MSAINEDTGQESRASTSDSATNDLGLKRNYNTVTWAAVTGATLYAVYKSNNTGSYGYIGETSGLSFVDDNILPDLSDAPVVADNPFDGTGNYPGKVCFFEQRLFFGRTRNRPNAIFATRSADFENMDKARPLQPDDALSLAASSGKVNAITQLVPASNLLVLTTDSIFQVVGANDDYVSPSPPPKIRRQNGRGVSDLKALLIDAVTFFQPRIGTEVRALGFSFEIDGFSSNDMSVFSSHLFENNRIIDWAFAEEPMSIIWCVVFGCVECKFSDFFTLNSSTVTRGHMYKLYKYHNQNSVRWFFFTESIVGTSCLPILLILRHCQVLKEQYSMSICLVFYMFFKVF